MTFKKCDDNCWRWEFGEGFQRETSYSLIFSWLITIIILFFTIMIAVPDRELTLLKIELFGAFSISVTILFAFISCLSVSFDTFSPVVNTILRIVSFSFLVSAVLGFILNRRFARQVKEEGKDHIEER